MKATLYDGKAFRYFPLNPSAIALSTSGNYSSTSVLNSVNPILTPRSAGSTYSISNALLYSFDGNDDQLPFILSMRYWASTQVKLKFDCDTYHVPRCYITSLRITPTVWDTKNLNGVSGKGSRILQATMDVTLAETLDPPTLNKLGQNKTSKKNTPRQQQEKTELVKKKLKNPTRRKALKIAGVYTVDVDDTDIVTIKSGNTVSQYPYSKFVALVFPDVTSASPIAVNVANITV